MKQNLTEMDVYDLVRGRLERAKLMVDEALVSSNLPWSNAEVRMELAQELRGMAYLIDALEKKGGNPYAGQLGMGVLEALASGLHDAPFHAAARKGE